jgi:hypothetical protein
VDKLVGARVQRQIARLLALAGDLQVRHAAPRVLEVLDLQLAQLLAPQGVIEQGREDGAIALVLDGLFADRGVLAGRHEQIAGLVVAERRRLAFAALGLGRFTPLTGLWVTAFFSQRYSNSEDSAA